MSAPNILPIRRPWLDTPRVRLGSFPQSEIDRALWLSRYAAFAVASGVEPDKAEFARAKIAAELPIFAPAQEEAILREAGFSDASLFYVGFLFVGWRTPSIRNRQAALITDHTS
jgi:hypothetical protein